MDIIVAVAAVNGATGGELALVLEFAASAILGGEYHLQSRLFGERRRCFFRRVGGNVE